MTLYWEGVAGASEHRTTGTRAWCFIDGTWCYNDILCRCCMEASSEFMECPICKTEGFVRRERMAKLAERLKPMIAEDLIPAVFAALDEETP